LPGDRRDSRALQRPRGRAHGARRVGRREMNGDFLRPPIMLSLDDVAIATGGALQGWRVAISGVTTDTRRISAGDLFVALTGERFDGHEFVPDAMRLGAV